MVIDDRLSPPELRHAIDRLTAGVELGELREGLRRLTSTYRNTTATRNLPCPRSDIERLAYVGARMPATYRATYTVLSELQSRCPELPITSLLDIGAGPGTSLWAATSVFGELSRATLVEPDAAMVAVAQELCLGSTLESQVETTWYTASLDQIQNEGSHDLVVVAYLLAELDDDQRNAAVDIAWQACQRAVVFIEPGSVDGFRHVIDARQRLLEYGASIVAPCPHERTCPLPEDDWCHFAARLNRTPLQRKIKGGSLAYEDEKYAFVAVTRGSGNPSFGRVIGRPYAGKGHVKLRVCAQEGLRDLTITKSSSNYHQARKIKWGDSWEHTSKCQQ